MTLQEIKESKKDVLTPEDIAEVLDQDPQCTADKPAGAPGLVRVPEIPEVRKAVRFSAARIFEMDGGERR